MHSNNFNVFKLQILPNLYYSNFSYIFLMLPVTLHLVNNNSKTNIYEGLANICFVHTIHLIVIFILSYWLKLDVAQRSSARKVESANGWSSKSVRGYCFYCHTNTVGKAMNQSLFPPMVKQQDKLGTLAFQGKNNSEFKIDREWGQQDFTKISTCQ